MIVSTIVVAFLFLIVISQLGLLLEREKQVADSLQQLDQVIAGLGTGVAQLITDTNALIAAVQAIPGQDFTSEVNAIQGDITNLQNLDTSVTTETGVLTSSSSSS